MFSAYSGRDEDKVQVIEAYLKAVRLYRDYTDATQDPEYSEVKTLDLYQHPVYLTLIGF